MFHTHTTWQDPNVMTSLSCPWTSAKLLTMSCFCWRNWNTMGSKHHGKTHGQIQETPCETPWKKSRANQWIKTTTLWSWMNFSIVVIHQIVFFWIPTDSWWEITKQSGKTREPTNVQDQYKTSATNISLTSAKARNHTIMYITGKLHHIHFPPENSRCKCVLSFGYISKKSTCPISKHPLL